MKQAEPTMQTEIVREPQTTQPRPPPVQHPQETSPSTPPRPGDGADDGRGVASCPCGQSFSRELVLGILGYNQTHVEWAGCSLHDIIQPSLLVPGRRGSALLDREPDSKGADIRQTVRPRRSGDHSLLVALGIFLRSMHRTQTNFTFEDTLSQIGLGYPFLFLLGFRSPRWQWGALAVILFGYWLAWALYPAPGPGFDYTAVGVPRIGSIITPASPPIGIRTAIWERVRPMVSQPVSPDQVRSSPTTEAI